MEEIIKVGCDLAKSIFQAHGFGENGEVVVSRTLRRSQVLPFFRALPSCLVGMEACASAHHWAGEIAVRGTWSA
ncbi:transposase [Bradyrhizobium sp. LB14.3]